MEKDQDVPFAMGNLIGGLSIPLISFQDYKWILNSAISKFCLSITTADSLPESDQLNNRLCINVDAFLTGVSEAESSSWSVSPNPADNFINIRIDDAKVTAYQGVIINGNGESVESFELAEHTTKIDLVDYLPGIYFLQIRNVEGAYFSRKFSVIH